MQQQLTQDKTCVWLKTKSDLVFLDYLLSMLLLCRWLTATLVQKSPSYVLVLCILQPACRPHLNLVVEASQGTVFGIQPDLLDRHQLPRVLVHAQENLRAAPAPYHLPQLPLALFYRYPAPPRRSRRRRLLYRRHAKRTREPRRRRREPALGVRGVAGRGRRRAGANLPRLDKQRMNPRWSPTERPRPALALGCRTRFRSKSAPRVEEPAGAVGDGRPALFPQREDAQVQALQVDAHHRGVRRRWRRRLRLLGSSRLLEKGLGSRSSRASSAFVVASAAAGVGSPLAGAGERAAAGRASVVAARVLRVSSFSHRVDWRPLLPWRRVVLIEARGWGWVVVRREAFRRARAPLVPFPHRRPSYLHSHQHFLLEVDA